MRKTMSAVAVVCLAALAGPARAQDGNVVMIHCLDVKAGAEAQYTKGMKDHAAFHKSRKDTWGWPAWQVMTGPQTGRMCAGSFGHTWADLDNPVVSEQDDVENVMATFGPYIEHHEATIWVRMADVSRPPDTPAPMNQLVTIHTRPGAGDRLGYLVKEFHDAIAKSGLDWRYDWYALASGGPDGTFGLVLPASGYAALGPGPKSFDQVLREAYGEAKAGSLLAEWADILEGSETSLVRGRPDLGYIPEAP